MAQRISQQTGAPASFPRYVFRWFSGRDLDGIERTDATFLHPGTISVRAHITRPSRWSMAPGWIRSSVRNGVVLAAAGTLVGTVLGYRTQVATAWAVAAWWALAALAWRVARWWAARVMDRDWVLPTHAALAPVLGVPADTPARSYLTIPDDFRENDETVIRVDVPDALAPEARPRVVKTVAEKLALGDVDSLWHLSGANPYVTISRAPSPPGKVTLDSLRKLLAKAPAHAPILGVGTREEIATIDLHADSPHIAVSAGSGGGKSVIARAVSMQILANGGYVVVADIKRVSQRYLRGLPGTAYCRTPEEIHHAILAVAEENNRRYEEIDIHGEEWAEQYPRILLILEELNGTMVRLQRWWDSVRGPDDPKRSPAVEAIGDLLFMGRQSQITILAIAQMLTAQAIGGPAARENFAVRILARYTQNAAKMLAPEVWPFPRSSRHPGRVQAVIGGIATAVQVLWTTPQEARDYVTTAQSTLGYDVPILELSTLAEQLAVPRPDAGPATAADKPAPLSPPTDQDDDQAAAPAAPVTPPAPAVPAGIPLSHACKMDGPLGSQGVSLDSARAATKRDPEFPSPVGRAGTAWVYDPTALARWVSNRERTA